MDHKQWKWQEPGKAWKGVGIYHVTLTVPSREPLLGKLVIPENDPKQAKVERTELGNSLIDELTHLHVYYPETHLLQYCLMPDHLHAIIYVTKPLKTTFNMVMRGFWQGAKKLGRANPSSIIPELYSGNPSSIIPELYSGNPSSIIPELYSGNPSSISPELNSGLTNEGNGMHISPIFTEHPFIRPLSRSGQLQTMIRYVQMNPQRLATKRLMPECFRVQEAIEIAGRQYSGVGNAELLQRAQYMPVHVRSIWVENAQKHGDDKQLRDYMNGCILAARKGAVMVSPFISEYEKAVMEVLLKEGLPFIYIADNGFRDYYKPQDSLFDAVARKQVLILSPWEYDPNKKHVSRAECVAMNIMAEEICSSSIPLASLCPTQIRQPNSPFLRPLAGDLIAHAYHPETGQQ